MFKVQNILFVLMVPVSIFVTIMFWVLLSVPVFSSPRLSVIGKVLQVHLHSTNLILPVAELFLCSIQQWPTKKEFWIPNLFLFLYGICITIVHVAGLPYWPYPFMYSLFGTIEENLNWLNILLFMIGSMVLMTLFYFGMLYLVKLRLRFMKDNSVDSAQGQSSQETIQVP
jgi:hypothetical protein